MIQVEPYLERIGVRLEPGERPGLDLLNKLIHHHVRRVPFENLIVMQKIPMTTEPDKLYDKIVVRRQGGVCFELNGLFHQLLRQLGYDVELLGASPFSSETRVIREPDTHMFNLVRVDGRSYLVDVGFGGNSPGLPVPMNGEEVEDLDGWYRVVVSDGWHFLQKNDEGEWRDLYKFQLVERELDYFEPKMRYIETSPHSSFNKRLFFSLVTDSGRVTLAERSLTVVKDGVKTKRELAEGELADVVRRYFGLEIRNLD